MKRSFVLYSVLLGVLSGCSTKPKFSVSCEGASCSIDSAFCADFNNALYNIQNDIQNPSEDVDLGDMLDAAFFFPAVTRIKTHVMDYHQPIYVSKEQLEIDLLKWEKWFNENKCKMTKVKADSLVRRFANG